MKTRLFWCFFIVINFFLFCPIQAVEFQKGVHFNQWFEANGVNQIVFEKYKKNDFRNVKKLGGNIIRLPINFEAMSSGNPDYLIDHAFFEYLDSAVFLAEELQLYLIIDNHTFYADSSVYLNIGR